MGEKIEGYCKCGSKIKVIKITNSKLSAFKHGHRYTTEEYEKDNDSLYNMFRCSDCEEQIDETFVPLNK